MEIYRKEGWDLNPNDTIVNKILKRLEYTGGICPCISNPTEKNRCPCEDYRENDVCHCTLYVKKDGSKD